MTVEIFIAIISLCLTSFSVGYAIGINHTKSK